MATTPKKLTLKTKGVSTISDALFRISMYWRIVYGFFRLLLGLILFRLVDVPLADIFYTLMKHEMMQDSNDFFIQLINPVLQDMSFTVTYFIAAYLIFWGLIDIILSINLLREKMWAFPASLYLIGTFVLYEIYRFSNTRSYVLLSIIIVDIIIIWLIWIEYRKRIKLLATE